MSMIFRKWQGFILGVSVWGLSQWLEAASLNIYTFNIRFYGVKGSHSESELNRRDTKVKNFIADKLSDADVLVFQEIVDVERFYQRVVADNFSCESYVHENTGHQHVVICLRAPYRLLRVDGDNNYSFEPVAMGKLRPAVYGVIVDNQNSPLSYVIGLHLKANAEFSSVRVQQVEMLAERIKQFKKHIPVIILGDFNTHNDDQEQFNATFAHLDLNLKHVNNNFRYTFRTSTTSSHLDHFWVSENVDTSSAKVYGPCNLDISVRNNREQLIAYNNYISDHCPVKVTLQTP